MTDFGRGRSVDTDSVIAALLHQAEAAVVIDEESLARCKQRFVDWLAEAEESSPSPTTSPGKDGSSIQGKDASDGRHEPLEQDRLRKSGQADVSDRPSAEEHPLSEVVFLTVGEVAAVMRVSKTTVYRMALGGRLPAIRGGRSFRVPGRERRRRGPYLVAAAAVLILGGPVAVGVVDSGAYDGRVVAGEPGHTHSTSPAQDPFFNDMEAKVAGTDPITNVTATVGMESKGFGTHIVLELRNVKGPLKGNLVAVSKTGEEEIVTSWGVPKWGYGIPNSSHPAAKKPLYVHGTAAMQRNEIDHFEIRTFEGKQLVQVQA